MTIEQVRELYEAGPFRRFSLHLPDGRQIAVEHPESVSFSRTGRLLLVTHPDDSESIVDLLLASGITVKAPVRYHGTER